MKDNTILIYGFDFSDKENYPIKDKHTSLVIPMVIDALSNIHDDGYDYSKVFDNQFYDKSLISCPYSGYGDNNYYIGLPIISTEDSNIKTIKEKYIKMVEQNKQAYEDIVQYKLNYIIDILKSNYNEDSPIYHIPEDYLEYAINYFEKLKTLDNRWGEIESTD